MTSAEPSVSTAARHHLRRGDALPLAVADDLGVRRRHPAQRRDRLFRPRLLDVAHQRVEQHDGEDRQGLVGQRAVALGQPQARGYHGRDQQQDDEDVSELVEELAPSGNGRLRGELIPAEALEPVLRLLAAQPAPSVRPERGHDLIGRPAIRGHLVLQSGTVAHRIL